MVNVVDWNSNTMALESDEPKGWNLKDSGLSGLRGLTTDTAG